MLVVAVGAGAAVGIVTRPTPVLPSPSATPRRTATPEPDTGPAGFQQPLSSGCATLDDVFVVSNGGGIGRSDGQRWQLVDTTLRSLGYAACTRDTVPAVGGASAWAVGWGGGACVLERAGWRQVETGTTAALRTGAGAAPTDAIAAGDDGVLLGFGGGWRALESGVKTALRASVRGAGAT